MSSTVGVSVVFTDLVGSTEMSTRVGAEAAERLRVVHFGLLRQPVESYGGREVKNLGDGIMAVFPGVGAALDAAIAMQQALDAHNAGNDGEPLMIRIGVATGDCAEEDGDYFGEPVIQASRLCAQADAGQILAPEVVRLLSPRGRHEFAPVGDLQLKGIPEPVPGFEVVWHPAEIEAPAAIPLPLRLAVRYPLRFVGRHAERDALQKTWEAASAGTRQVVLLSGEAGLGKTRLATEFAREAFDAGALVLYGRCDEELVRPYGPWAEAFGHYVAHAGDEELARFDVRSLSALVPALRERMGVDPVAMGNDGDEYLLFAAVADVLAWLATARPVVIVLDDLHWADGGTLQLLRHLAAHSTSDSLLVLGTYRDTDIGADDALTAALAALRREGGVERIALVGLSDTEIFSLLEVAAGQALDADGMRLSHLLRSETGGNPFFVSELLRHLAESGEIERDGDRWVATVDLDEAGLPQSVREVVGARVRRLGADAHRVLTAAAVVGRDFDVALVAGAIGIDGDTVLDVLEPAMGAGLVDEAPGFVDRFSFSHALVQHTLYQDVSTSRRARLHRAIAETIEALADDGTDRAAELATHWFAASPSAELDKAIRYAIQAGEQALAARAPAESARWYRKALEATGDRDDRRRCDVLVRLGDAERQAGEPAYRDHLLHAAHVAQQLGDEALLVAAALANNRGWHSATGQVDTDRVEVLELALAAVGSGDSPERARLLTTLALELAFSGDPRRFDLGREGVSVARRTKDPETILDAIQRSLLDTPDLFEEGRQLVEEALHLTDGTDNLLRRFYALNHGTLSTLGQGDFHAARRLDVEAQAIAKQLGQPILRWNVLISGSLLALVAGEVDEAERLANDILELGADTSQPDTLVFFGGLLMGIRWFQGHEREVTPLIVQAVEDNPGLPGFRSFLAYQLAELGDLDGARRVFDAIAADGFNFPYDQTWLQMSMFAAETAQLLGDTDAAAVMYERLAPFTGQIARTGISCTGAVSHYLGLLCALLGRVDEAEALFVDALARHERLEAPFLRARTMLALADLLRDREPERARTLLGEALALADTFGMAGIRARVLAAQSD